MTYIVLFLLFWEYFCIFPSFHQQKFALLILCFRWGTPYPCRNVLQGCSKYNARRENHASANHDSWNYGLPSDSKRCETYYWTYNIYSQTRFYGLKTVNVVNICEMFIVFSDRKVDASRRNSYIPVNTKRSRLISVLLNAIRWKLREIQTA